MRYPVYYLDVVQDITTRYGVDPLLMYSLIRHESLFDAYATAAAGERGLTQVIPSTAEYIASELGIPNFQHSSLSRPYMSVEFGTFYLDEQLDLFGGNVTAALAAYNAGPGASAAMAVNRRRRSRSVSDYDQHQQHAAVCAANLHVLQYI